MSAAKRAVVAMSGGVDSSVAAALMVEAGYEVTGIMLKLWRGEAANSNSGCCNLGAAEDARRVADSLGIPFYVLNFAERFETTVIRNFHRDYAAGRTPNPCVRCNQWVKFGALLDRARVLGADYLVTGHYARRRENSGRYRLLRGRDVAKDQSYVLWMLTQDALSRSLFPIGEMNKSETRRIAADLGLRTATKPDSQEICFVREGDTKSYVREHLPEATIEGPIVDASGAVVGRHEGIGHYTVGQRKGLGVALGHPVFVTSIDAARNTISVGDRADLEVSAFTADEASFVDEMPSDGTRVYVQHRAHGDVHVARIHVSGPGRALVEFEQPVVAIAPGQSAAYYSFDDPDELLGGGVIRTTVPAAVAV
ncbi:MAG: tRNA 2-thiouridine(34) synthase MnmA [Actinomycetota bacterium]|nr:tRNA 2-thiouridine(34) synthase MnmA [Actinomycetota bacterium]